MRSLAWVYRELGEIDRATTLNEEGLADARRLGNDEMEATFLGVLATAGAEKQHVDDAFAMLAQSMTLWQVLGDPMGLMVELSRVARVLTLAGKPVAAVQVLSRADSLRQELGVAFEPWNVRLNATTIAAIRAVLDDARFTAAWADGSQLTINEAIEIGLAGARPGTHDEG